MWYWWLLIGIAVGFVLFPFVFYLAFKFGGDWK